MSQNCKLCGRESDNLIDAFWIGRSKTKIQVCQDCKAIWSKHGHLTTDEDFKNER